MAGWVYILSNPAMPGLLKIGYTDRDPFARAKEISQVTGVPFDFVVEYQIYVSDPYVAEQKIHKNLLSVRVNYNREFFSCSYQEAFEAIRYTINTLKERDPNFIIGEEISHKVNKENLEKEILRKEIIKQLNKEKELRLNSLEAQYKKDINNISYIASDGWCKTTLVVILSVIFTTIVPFGLFLLYIPYKNKIDEDTAWWIGITFYLIIFYLFSKFLMKKIYKSDLIALEEKYLSDIKSIEKYYQSKIS